MRASQIEARAVAKVVFIALAVAVLFVLLAIAVLHTRTTLHWVLTAIFLALALDPAVSVLERIRIAGRPLPRLLAILVVYAAFFAGFVLIVLHVLPPVIRDIEALAKKLPTYVADFEHWAENSRQFQDLNDKYDLTQKLNEQASSLPSRLGDAAGEAGHITVELLEHLLAFITVMTLTFFLLLDGRGMFERGTDRLRTPTRERMRRIGTRIAAVVRAYVTVNVVLAIAAGLLTWGFLEIQGFHLALPLAALVAFLDLIPLIGFTIGGLVVAAALAIDGDPYDALVWLVVFLSYQQLQDRVIQPLMYRSGALKVNPAVAIVAVIVGANLAGVLGALLAIPVAASLGVVFDELVLPRPAAKPKPKPA